MARFALRGADMSSQMAAAAQLPLGFDCSARSGVPAKIHIVEELQRRQAGGMQYALIDGKRSEALSGAKATCPTCGSGRWPSAARASSTIGHMPADATVIRGGRTKRRGIDLRREHLIDKVCIQEILLPSDSEPVALEAAYPRSLISRKAFICCLRRLEHF
jgi:hypothetical protein